LEKLAEHIADELGERSFCLVFSPELEHRWPSQRIGPAEQERQIQTFAEYHGWSVSVLDVGYGIKAIFRKASQYQ